jgi:predicted short-subunit dehydrogenase-like oxidoreductase (DUF2520 family)
MSKPRISLIGYGRLGQQLTRWLAAGGYSLEGIFSRGTLPMSPDIFNATTTGSFPSQKHELGDLLILSVNDASIPEIVEQLSSFDLSGICIVHTSGALPSAVLDPLRDKGAHLGAFHPLQTFGPVGKKNPFKGISISIEGDWKCIEMLLEMSRNLGAQPYQTDARGKMLIHLACVWVSNYVQVLLQAAQSTGAPPNMSSQQLFTMLRPLIDQALDNATEMGAANALTGPASRADAITIEHHLKLLETHPDFRALYISLAQKAASMAHERGSLDVSKLEHLTKILSQDEKV